MLSKDIKHMADQLSYFGEKAVAITHTQDQLLHIIRMMRDFERRAKQLERFAIPPEFQNHEIDISQFNNVIRFDAALSNYRENKKERR